MATKKTIKAPLTVETLNHDATRKNIPTAEYQSVMGKDEQKPVRVEYLSEWQGGGTLRDQVWWFAWFRWWYYFFAWR